jgi:hypothetical protein
MYVHCLKLFNCFLSLIFDRLTAYYRMIMAMDYHRDTPSDYQAPHFHHGDENISRFLNLGHFSDNRVLKTGFHRYARSNLRIEGELLMMKSVTVGWHLPGPAAHLIRTPQRVGNGNPGPGWITRRAQRPGMGVAYARQSSALSDFEGGHTDTQPEAMRQIGTMVRPASS